MELAILSATENFRAHVISVHVRFGSLADILGVNSDVRLSAKSRLSTVLAENFGPLAT
jgi:hypothetical protein